MTLTTSYQKIGTSGTVTFGYAEAYLELYAKYNSQSITNNTTNWSIEARLVVTRGYIGEYSGTSLSLSGDGISSSQSCGTGDFTSCTLGSASGTTSHSSSGTKSVSASASIYFSAWGQSISVSGSADLPTIPRYTSITSFSVSKRNETSLTFNWKTADTIDYVWYSTNNGTNWTGYNVSDGTSGSFNVSGLSANTSYNCKLRVRRKDSQLTTDSSAVSQTTYDYPYCSSASNFTIGNNINISLYNPLSRTVSISIYGNNNTLICSASRNVNGSTSISSTTAEINSQYASIPNAKSGTFKVSVTYGSSTKTKSSAGTYSIKGTETPTFSNFTYEDTDNTTTPLTGNNQVLVAGHSNCLFTISTVDKAVAKNSASMSKYICQWGSKSGEVSYSSSSDVTKSVDDSTTGTLKVQAVDSRGLTTIVTKNITYVPYTSATITSLETQRDDGVDAKTCLKGKFSIFNGSWDGTNSADSMNRLKYVGYSVYVNNAWSQYHEITSEVLNKAVVSTNGNIKTYEFDFDDEIQIHENGSSGGFTIGTEYQIRFLIKDGNATTIFTPSGYQALYEVRVSDGTVAICLHKDNNGVYHIGLNGMSDDTWLISIGGVGVIKQKT